MAQPGLSPRAIFSSREVFFAAALSLSVILPLQSVQANNNTESMQPQKSPTYLGISIDEVPALLQHQLADILPLNQGILVRDVLPDSPAAKAKLQTHDILLSYNEQKLFSTKQLTELVRSSQKDEKVTLKLVRQGKLQTLIVTIDEQPREIHSTNPIQEQLREQLKHHQYSRHHPMMRHFPSFDTKIWQNMLMDSELQKWLPSELTTKDWDSFQSLSVEKLKDNQYQASIEFFAKDGEKKRFQFQGSRAEIQEQLEQAEQLPNKQKQQLLNLLSANQGSSFPSMGQLLPKGVFTDKLYGLN